MSLNKKNKEEEAKRATYLAKLIEQKASNKANECSVGNTLNYHDQDIEVEDMVIPFHNTGQSWYQRNKSNFVLTHKENNYDDDLNGDASTKASMGPGTAHRSLKTTQNMTIGKAAGSRPSLNSKVLLEARQE